MWLRFYDLELAFSFKKDYIGLRVPGFRVEVRV